MAASRAFEHVEHDFNRLFILRRLISDNKMKHEKLEKEEQQHRKNRDYRLERLQNMLHHNDDKPEFAETSQQEYVDAWLEWNKANKSLTLCNSNIKTFGNELKTLEQTLRQEWDGRTPRTLGAWMPEEKNVPHPVGEAE